MQFLEKLWEIWENIMILNLPQQKEEDTIWCQNQFIILQSFSETEILINKLFYLGLSIRELSKILMWEILYDYVKPKYDEKVKLCSMNTNSFTVYIKIDDIYKDITRDVETGLKNNKKVIGLMKDELGGKIMTKFVGLKAQKSLSSRKT